MTALREAAQQALEALEMSRRFVYADSRPQCDEAIDALHAALAQQDEPVQPVAWMFTDREGTEFFEQREDWDGWWTPLYTAPPQRMPLTEEEINAEWHELDGEASALFKRVIRKFARAIERAHGIGERP